MNIRFKKFESKYHIPNESGTKRATGASGKLEWTNCKIRKDGKNIGSSGRVSSPDRNRKASTTIIVDNFHTGVTGAVLIISSRLGKKSRR